MDFIWIKVYLCFAVGSFFIGWWITAAVARKEAEEEGRKPVSVIKTCFWNMVLAALFWPFVWSFAFAWTVTH